MKSSKLVSAILVASVSVPSAALAQGDFTTSPQSPPPKSSPTKSKNVSDTRSPDIPDWEGHRMEPRDVEADDIHFQAGKGLKFRSRDRDFGVAIKSWAQFQLAAPDLGSNDPRITFFFRRARLLLSGHLLDPHFKYRIDLGLSPGDVSTRDGVVGSSPLFHLYVDMTHMRDLSLRLGQFQVPFSRARVTSSTAMQFVDRSIVNREFNLDRDLGLDIRSMNFLGQDLFRYHLGVYTGEGPNSFEPTASGLLMVGRVELLPFGLFKDYAETDFSRGGFRLSLGAAYAYAFRASADRLTRGTEPTDGGTTDFRMATADLVAKFHGWSMFGEIIWRDGKRIPGDLEEAPGTALPVAPSRDGFGWSVQSGYLLPHVPVEVVARFASITGSSRELRNALNASKETAVGAGYFFAQNAVKLQTDYSRLQSDGTVAEDRIRLQLQVVF